MLLFRRREARVQGLHEQELIAVAGMSDGCGTTHFAISIASYLVKVRGWRVAYMELNNSDEIGQLVELRQEEEKEFSFHGIRFYPNASKDLLARVMQQQFDAILLDWGCVRQKTPNQIQFCHRRFLLMDAASWKRNQLSAWLEAQEKKAQIKYELLFPMAEEKELHFFKKQYAGDVFSIPFQRDPFSLRPPMILFLNKLL